MPVRISTTARPTDLKPKTMAFLYEGKNVDLLRKNDVLHLVFDVRDWADVGYYFGQQIAGFRTADKRWYTDDGIKLSQKELLDLIGNGQVCTLGKDCPKHRG